MRSRTLPSTFLQPDVPDRATTGFVPSRHGFRFANRFGVPFLAPALQRAGLSGVAYGLCGGMVRLAHDAFCRGQDLPGTAVAPRMGTPLWRALVQGQLHSLGGLPLLPHVGTFARWTVLSDAEARRRTGAAWPGVRRALAAGQSVPLGLIYTDRLTRLWKNHQVLACGFADGPGVLRLYDPNYPLRDDVTLRAAWQEGSGLMCRQYAGSRAVRRVRGFFALPYSAPAAAP